MENTTNLSLPKEKLERDPVKTVILASMMGTAIEFFDFYAYGTASAAYFPSVFFPQTTPLLATLLSLLTFGVAFVARPFGSRCCFAFAASFKASVLAANGQALFWSQLKTRRKTSGLCTEPFLKSAHRSDSSFATVCSSFWKTF